jgi:Tol biopolymer transport system component
MKCDRAKQIILEETASGSRLTAGLHIMFCSTCRRQANRRRALAKELQHISPVMPPSSLVAAWQESRPTAEVSHGVSRGRRRKLVLATAALLMLSGGWLGLQSARNPSLPLASIAALPKAACNAGLIAGAGIEVAEDPLLTSASGEGFFWWPDGESAVYCSRSDPSKKQRNQVWRLHLESMQKELLLEETCQWIFNPKIAQDGSHLVYCDGQHLKVLDLANGTIRLVPDSFGGSNLDLSPDGKWLAFARSHPNDTESGRQAEQMRGIWLQSLTGGKLIRIYPGPEVENPWHFSDISDLRWSPDGRWIAFVGQKEEYVTAGDDPCRSELLAYTSEIILVHPDGSNLHTVALLHRKPSGSDLLGPQCWSPDSKHLVFSWAELAKKPTRFPFPESTYVERGITILDIDSGKLTSVVPPETFTAPIEFFGTVNWSPKSNHVAFTVMSGRISDGSFRYDIYAASTDTGNIVPLAQAAKYCNNSRPIWSPDGESLLYIQSRRRTPEQKGKTDLWLVKMNRTEPDGTDIK